MYPTTRRHVPESRNPQLCVEPVTRPPVPISQHLRLSFPLTSEQAFYVVRLQ